MRATLAAILMVSSALAQADDSYSHVVYSAVAAHYWCKYRKIPTSVADFAKVTNITDPDPRITLDPKKWFSIVKMEGDGDVLKITYRPFAPGDIRTETVTSRVPYPKVVP